MEIRKPILALILICSFHYASVAQQKIDSLIQLSEQLQDTSRWNKLIDISEYFFTKDLDSAFHFIQLAHEEIPQNDLDRSSEILLQYANIQIERLQLDGIDDLLNQLIEHYTKTADLEALATCYNHLGRFHYNNLNNDHEPALAAFRKSIEIESGLNDPIRYAKSESNFALMLDAMGRHEEALQSYYAALNALQNAGEKRDVLKLYFNLSYGFGIENRPYFSLDSAIHYGMKGIALGEELDFAFGVAKCQGVVSSALIRKGITDKLALRRGLEVAQASKAFFKNTPFKVDYYHAWLWEGFAQEGLGNGRAAIKIAHDLLDTDYPDESECHRLLHLAYKQVGNYKEALHYHELHRIYTDSVTTESITERLADLQTKYETEKKDQEILTLSQDNEIKALEIKQRNFTLFGSIGVLGLIMALGYSWFKKRSAEKDVALSDVNQKVLRLQMNPHFIFNTLGVIQHLLRGQESKKAAKYLAKFSKLMRQTLEYSREDFIYLEDEIELLDNYVQLQKLSTGQEFEHSITTAEDIDPSEVKVPPMIAQPFIENAIAHGKIGGFEDGKLSLHFSRSGNIVQIEIKDNGVGVADQVPKSGHKSLSTQITKERLQIFEEKFKAQLTFSIAALTPTQKRRGTYILLQVPLI